MSSIGTGYDLSASTFSPDGRVFQVEYAMKAVENSSTAIGIRCKDGQKMSQFFHGQTCHSC
uniref:Proteasome alpha-type subunits domain-containing protein n=3 Tax=Oncorhynchus TaxID=8016 RepID=A0A8C7FFN1_ONCKI